jgi:hypothetical protein
MKYLGDEIIEFVILLERSSSKLCFWNVSPECNFDFSNPESSAFCALTLKHKTQSLQLTLTASIIEQIFFHLAYEIMKWIAYETKVETINLGEFVLQR